jgi:hypothetical protein
MGTGVGEAALAAEAVGAAEAATAGAGFLEGMAGISALEGAGVAGLGLETGAGLSGLMGAGYGGASTLAPSLQSAISGTATVMPEVAAQTMAAANQGAVPAAFMDVGGTGVSSGLPFPTGGMGVQPPLPSLSPATAADVTQMMDVGFNPATATTEMGGNLARQTMNYVDPVEMLKAPTAVEKAGFTNPLTSAYNWYKEQDKPTQYGIAGLGAMQAAKALNKPQGVAAPEKYSGPLSKFSYSPDTYTPYTYKPYAAGGPVEEMSNRNAIGANTGYPQSDIQQGAYATPWQTPVSRNVVAGAGDVGVDQMTGMERMAGGGIANLGGYSDGGRLLKGPGDGMSDNIPATIGRKQPARLADGEFVVPADVVSGLGNGSTEAGAKQLYKMLDKVRSARTGTKKQGKQIKPEKYTPA